MSIQFQFQIQFNFNSMQLRNEVHTADPELANETTSSIPSFHFFAVPAYVRSFFSIFLNLAFSLISDRNEALASGVLAQCRNSEIFFYSTAAKSRSQLQRSSASSEASTSIFEFQFFSETSEIDLPLFFAFEKISFFEHLFEKIFFFKHLFEKIFFFEHLFEKISFFEHLFEKISFFEHLFENFFF